MAIDPNNYEELGGSPKIRGTRKGMTAERMFKVANSYLPTFLAVIMPAPSSGYGELASVPGYSWLTCVSFEIEPFTDKVDPDDGTGAAGCEWWRVVLRYDSSPPDQQQGPREGGNGQNPGDGSGPGGDAGSSGGEQVEFLEHDVDIGGEFLTVPDHGLQWSVVRNGSRAANGVKAGIILPLIDHDLKIINCKTPPWGAIRGCVGKVNDGAFAGAESQTALFLGCKAKRGRNKTGEVVWELHYKISERGQQLSWNMFFRPETGQFEFLEKKDGTRLYPATNFAVLFQNLNVAP